MMQNHVNERERVALFAMRSLKELNTDDLRALLYWFGSFSNLFDTKAAEIRGRLDRHLPEKKINAVVRTATNEDLFYDAEDEYHQLLTSQIRMYTYNDPELIAAFGNNGYTPVCIFVKGDILPDSTRRTACITGSRTPTKYGLRLTRIIAEDLSEDGIQIVNQAHPGIEQQALITASKCKYRAFVVLPCGLECWAIQSTLDRFKDKNVCFMTEYVPKAEMLADSSKDTCRLIASMAPVTVIPQLESESDPCIAAQLESSCQTMLIAPGEILLPQSKGCNDLLRHGQPMLYDTDQVVCELNTYSRFSK